MLGHSLTKRCERNQSGLGSQGRQKDDEHREVTYANELARIEGRQKRPADLFWTPSSVPPVRTSSAAPSLSIPHPPTFASIPSPGFAVPRAAAALATSHHVCRLAPTLPPGSEGGKGWPSPGSARGRMTRPGQPCHAPHSYCSPHVQPHVPAVFVTSTVFAFIYALCCFAG